MEGLKLWILTHIRAEKMDNWHYFANEISLLFSGKSSVYSLHISRLSHLKSILFYKGKSEDRMEIWSSGGAFCGLYRRKNC